MHTRTCFILLLSLFTLPTYSLVEDQWIEAGSAKARFSENTLTIFPKTEDSFSKLRFHVSHGDIILHQAKIYLVRGEIFHVNLQKSIKGASNGDGQSYSRIIPLIVSQQSPIKKVKVFYKFKHQQTSSMPVTVELLGIPAN